MSSNETNLFKNALIGIMLFVYNFLIIVKYNSVISFVKSNPLFDLFLINESTKLIAISLMALFNVFLIVITIFSFVYQKDKNEFKINSNILMITYFIGFIFASANSIL
jgi:hypothetical protein